MTTLAKTKTAKEVFDKLQHLSMIGNDVYWKKAELFYKLKKDGLYKYVFGDEDGQSWTSFCAEIGVPPSSADQKIRNWEFFVRKHGLTVEKLTGFDTSCLYYITRYKKEAPLEEIMEGIESIKALGRNDFIQVISGKEDCHHDHTETQTKKKCTDCQRTLKYTNDNKGIHKTTK